MPATCSIPRTHHRDHAVGDHAARDHAPRDHAVRDHAIANTGDRDNARARRNRGHWAALLHVIRAHLDGRPIEQRHGDVWVLTACPHFLDHPSHYRIKP